MIASNSRSRTSIVVKVKTAREAEIDGLSDASVDPVFMDCEFAGRINWILM